MLLEGEKKDSIDPFFGVQDFGFFAGDGIVADDVDIDVDTVINGVARFKESITLIGDVDLDDT